MAEDGSCDVIGPSCAFAVAGDGAFGAGFSQVGEGGLSQNAEVFRAVIFSVEGAVFVETHVGHPVQAGLDRPMGGQGCRDGVRGEAG